MGKIKHKSIYFLLQLSELLSDKLSISFILDPQH